MKNKSTSVGNEEAPAMVAAPATKPSEMAATLAALAAEVQEWKGAAGGSITEVMAAWVSAQYFVAARKELADTPEGPERFKLLRHMASDTAALQRGSSWAGRLQLDRDRLALEQAKFDRIVHPPPPPPRPDYLRPLTDEERKAIVAKVDSILGIPTQLNVKGENRESGGKKEGGGSKIEEGPKPKPAGPKL